METNREKACRTITVPITLIDVARELGVSERFIQEEIGNGRLKVDQNYRITGDDLANYLISKRESSGKSINEKQD